MALDPDGLALPTLRSVTAGYAASLSLLRGHDGWQDLVPEDRQALSRLSIPLALEADTPDHAARQRTMLDEAMTAVGKRLDDVVPSRDRRAILYAAMGSAQRCAAWLAVTPAAKAEHGRTAVDALNGALAIWDQAAAGAAWPLLQVWLGQAHATQGETDTPDSAANPEALDRASQAFRRALRALDGPEQALARAHAHALLGQSLHARGVLGDSPTPLDNAAESLRAALVDLADLPLAEDIASLHLNLGTVLTSLASRPGQDRMHRHLDQAETSFALALETFTEASHPDDWAMIQNNLGTVLATLSRTDDAPDRLDRAIAHYEAALRVRDRDRAPDSWRATRANLASALLARAAFETDTKSLDAAVEAYRDSALGTTKTGHALARQTYAERHNGLGVALLTLGERTGEAATLSRAAQCFRDALAALDQQQAPLDWAMAQNNLGNALTALGESRGAEGKDALAEAVDAYKASLSVYGRDSMTWDWATTRNNLASATASLARAENRPDRLREARALYQEAAEALHQSGFSAAAAVIQRNLDRLDQELG